MRVVNLIGLLARLLLFRVADRAIPPVSFVRSFVLITGIMLLARLLWVADRAILLSAFPEDAAIITMDMVWLLMRVSRAGFFLRVEVSKYTFKRLGTYGCALFIQ
jgi:hypothetical protein